MDSLKSRFKALEAALDESGEYSYPANVKRLEGRLKPNTSVSSEAGDNGPTISTADEPSPRNWKLERDKEIAARVRQEAMRCAERIMKSELLRTAIAKAINAGQPPETILLQALECIELMTGDGVLLAQYREMLPVYAYATRNEGARDILLADARERLAHIERAYEREIDPRKRHNIGMTIRAHKAEIERLEGI